MSKLRVYYQILDEPTYIQDVASLEEANLVINSIADFLNFMIEAGAIPDHCSVAGLEEFDEKSNDWYEWYDENGLDINEHFEDEEDDEDEM